MIDAVGSQLAVRTFGCLEPTPAALPGDHLIEINRACRELITAYRPDAVAIEDLHFVQNVTTGLKVAEARGVLVLAVRQAGLLLAEYKPNQIKSTVAGYGLAPKQQIQRMVQLLLKLPTLPKPDDAADGLAIAITHAILGRHQSRLQKQL